MTVGVRDNDACFTATEGIYYKRTNSDGTENTTWLVNQVGTSYTASADTRPSVDATALDGMTWLIGVGHAGLGTVLGAMKLFTDTVDKLEDNIPVAWAHTTSGFRQSVADGGSKAPDREFGS